MPTKNFMDLEKHELVAYAKTELGLEVTMKMTIDAIRGAVADALGVQAVAAVNEVTPTTKKDRPVFPNAVAVTGKGVDNGVDWDDLVVINVAESKEDAQPVPVAVNGYALLLKRGVNLAIPRAYAKVLEHAVEDSITMDPDTGEMHKRQVSAYPFTYVQQHPH